MRTLSFEFGHHHLGVAGQDPVADAGKEIGDWIGRHSFTYQLDLMTPGMSPLRAYSRKQTRHSSNFRRKAPRTPALLAAVVVADLPLGRLLVVGHIDGLGHG
jgi:hypothetical protein